jgi:predicted transposase/invertase (TIGR01784 family)
MDKNAPNAAENGAAAKEQAHRYDEGYKDVLSNESMFLQFLQKYIAAPWTGDISPGSLEKVNTSFTTDEYKNLESDIIYKLKINGSDVYFYVLMELQSSVDYTMPFRLLRYMMKLLEHIFQNTDKNERERKGFRFPAIVPIILYNGVDIWTVARSFREYTENGDIFGNNIINFEYLLFDLKRRGDDSLSSPNTLLDIVLSLDKRRLETKDYAVEIERLKELTLTSELTEEEKLTLSKWVKYVCFRGNVPANFDKIFYELINQKGDNSAMTHAFTIMFEEHDKELVEQSKLEAKLEIAKNLLAKGMKPIEVAEATGLMIDDVLRLQS